MLRHMTSVKEVKTDIMFDPITLVNLGHVWCQLSDAQATSIQTPIFSNVIAIYHSCSARAISIEGHQFPEEKKYKWRAHVL